MKNKLLDGVTEALKKHTKHTPGPWIEDGNGLAPTWDVSSRNGSVCTVTTNRQDARLIAAAPELLEALTLLTNQLIGAIENKHIAGWDEGAIYKAKRALAKARGND